MTIPPIAVESAKEAAHRLLELCMSDAPPLDKDLVRRHTLDVIEALTDDEEDSAGRCVCHGVGLCVGVPGESDACGACLARDPEAPCLTEEPGEVVLEITADSSRFEAALAGSLEVLHRAAGCGCKIDPPVRLLVCPECQQGKHGNCDTTAWDTVLDEPAACTCTHPGWGQPERTPEALDRLGQSLDQTCCGQCPGGTCYVDGVSGA